MLSHCSQNFILTLYIIGRLFCITMLNEYQFFDNACVKYRYCLTLHRSDMPEKLIYRKENKNMVLI